MTATATDQQPNGSASDPPWRGQEHRIELRGASYRLRLVRSLPAGWRPSTPWKARRSGTTLAILGLARRRADRRRTD